MMGAVVPVLRQFTRRPSPISFGLKKTTSFERNPASKPLAASHFENVSLAGMEPIFLWYACAVVSSPMPSRVSQLLLGRVAFKVTVLQLL
jgi:hypothetical protein